MSETYRVTRFYQDEAVPSEVVETGLSLEEARAYCRDPESSSRSATGANATARTGLLGPWFCGFMEE